MALFNTFSNPMSASWSSKPNQSYGAGAGFASGTAKMDSAVAGGSGAVNGAIATGRSAVSAAQQGLADVKAGGKTVNQAITNINSAAAGITPDIGAIRQQAGNVAAYAPQIANQATQVNNIAGRLPGQADDIRAVVNGLTPYEDQFKSYAAQLWDQGGDMYKRGVGFYDNAAALLSKDSSIGGLVSDYLGNLDKYDPTFKVEQAATDVAKAQKLAQDEMARNLSRRGISGSAGATTAAQQNLAATYAAALSGAKTNARNQALEDQRKALETAFTKVVELAGQGDTTARTGSALQDSAGNQLGNAEKTRNDIASGLKGAADLDTAAGELFKAGGALFGDAANVDAAAGKLYGDAGSLGATQASAYQKAADAMNQFLSVQNQANNTIQTAYGTLEKAQGGAADYYGNLFRSMQGGGGGGGGGVQIVNNDQYTAERLMRDAEFHRTYENNKI